MHIQILSTLADRIEIVCLKNSWMLSMVHVMGGAINYCRFFMLSQVIIVKRSLRRAYGKPA